MISAQLISNAIVWEICALAVSFFGGVRLAWIYDNIRAFRRVIRHRTIIFITAEDVMFGIYAGVSMFVMLFSMSDGVARGFLLAGVAVGAALYFAFLSRIYIKYCVKIVEFLMKPLRFMLKKMCRLRTIIVKACMKCKNKSSSEFAATHMEE